jgi:vancomycin resistance protein YoaR
VLSAAAARRLALLGLASFLAVGGAGAAIAVRTADASQRRDVLLSHAHWFVDGNTSLRIGPKQLATLVALRDGQLVGDRAAFRKLLAQRFPARAAQNAQLRIVGERVEVAPSAPARSLDLQETLASLLREPAQQAHRVHFDWKPSEVTTSELRQLGIRSLVSQFTTNYPPGEARVINIKRAAQLLDGTIIPAGASFSMNDALGQRTLERGFVPAPMIAGGRLVDSVGGGISQVATTIYNAAFFAGLDLVEHTPHSFYIDRYPIGREATISWGGPELVFRNDWNAAVLMKLSATDTAITVRLYSSLLGRRVETTTGTPTRWIAPAMREVLDASLSPGSRVIVQQPGGRGFTVEYTRRVYRQQKLLRDEHFRTRYDAQDGIVRVGVASLEPR